MLEKLEGWMPKEQSFGLKPYEKNCVKHAVADFAGEQTVPTWKDYPNNKSELLDLGDKNIVLTYVTYDADTEKWSEPLFDYLVSQLPYSERIALLNTQSDKINPQKIIQLRRKRMDPSFVKLLYEHAKNYHAGALSPTEIIDLNGDPNPEANVDGNETKSEHDSINEIRKAAGNTIKYYGLNYRHQLNNPIASVNQMSDVLEPEYAKSLTLHSLTSERNMASGAIVLTSPLVERLLETVTHVFGESAAQVTSQLVGEMMIMGVAASDRAYESINSKIYELKKNNEELENEKVTMTQYISILAQIVKDMPSGIQKLIFDSGKRYADARKSILKRSLLLGANVANTIVLAYMVHKTGNLDYLAGAPGPNTLATMVYELAERAETFKEVHISAASLAKLQDKMPKPIRFIMQKLHSGWTIAYSDMVKNDYAMGGLAGSFVGSAFVPIGNHAGWPLEYTLTASGVLAENAVALGYGMYRMTLDPYKTFLKDVIVKKNETTTD